MLVFVVRRESATTRRRLSAILIEPRSQASPPTADFAFLGERMNGRRIGRARPCLLAVAVGLLLAGCASNKAVMDIRGAVMYTKPEITAVSHALVDRRTDGGAVVVTVTLLGDPGLKASFDINPGIAQRVAMRESEDGVYAGEFTFPTGTVGGPFTIVGMLSHEAAGEIVRTDPEQMFVPMVDRRR